MGGRYADIITYTHFADGQVKGLDMAVGYILPFWFTSHMTDPTMLKLSLPDI